MTTPHQPWHAPERATIKPIGPAVAVRNLNPDQYHLAVYNNQIYAVTWDYRGRPECQSSTATLDDSDIVQPVRVRL